MSAGANQLQNIGFTVQDENKLQDAALKDAIENARKKAQAMADQMGVKLGTLLDFAETSSGSPRPLPVMRESMMMMAKSSDSASPVPSRDVETQASVSMTWKIMP
jgi:uncharacterized protein YggE